MMKCLQNNMTTVYIIVKEVDMYRI